MATIDDAPGAAALDALVRGELRSFLHAAARLRVAAARARRIARGWPEHAEACRLSQAAETVLLTTVARPLLAARTQAQQARDRAVAAATEDMLEREAADGRLSTRGD